MRIAQLAPLWESVPPPAYGGTELIVGLLTDELVRRGHEVTLFASGDSRTLAKLQPGCDAALRPLRATPQVYTVQEQGQLSRVFTSAQEFDIIHSHVDFVAFPYADLVKTPVVHTLHGPLASTVERVFMQHAHQNFVSISNAQRRPQLGINYVATVYNATLFMDSRDLAEQVEYWDESIRVSSFQRSYYETRNQCFQLF